MQISFCDGCHTNDMDFQETYDYCGLCFAIKHQRCPRPCACADEMYWVPTDLAINLFFERKLQVDAIADTFTLMHRHAEAFLDDQPSKKAGRSSATSQCLNS